jgi:hypothetical protein
MLRVSKTANTSMLPTSPRRLLEIFTNGRIPQFSIRQDAPRTRTVSSNYTREGIRPRRYPYSIAFHAAVCKEDYIINPAAREVSDPHRPELVIGLLSGLSPRFRPRQGEWLIRRVDDNNCPLPWTDYLLIGSLRTEQMQLLFDVPHNVISEEEGIIFARWNFYPRREIRSCTNGALYPAVSSV